MMISTAAPMVNIRTRTITLQREYIIDKDRQCIDLPGAFERETEVFRSKLPHNKTSCSEFIFVSIRQSYPVLLLPASSSILLSWAWQRYFCSCRFCAVSPDILLHTVYLCWAGCSVMGPYKVQHVVNWRPENQRLVNKSEREGPKEENPENDNRESANPKERSPRKEKEMWMDAMHGTQETPPGDYP